MFSNERQKVSRSTLEGRWEETGRTRATGNNQYIFCEEKKLFSIKEKKIKKK